MRLEKGETTLKPYNQIPPLIGLGFVLALFFTIGMAFMKGKEGVVPFLKGFPVVFVIAILAYVMEAQATMTEYGIGYAAWAIIFGIITSTLFTLIVIPTVYWLLYGQRADAR